LQQAFGEKALSPWGIFRRLGPGFGAPGLGGHLNVEFGLVFGVPSVGRCSLEIHKFIS
jgi:hypothetical protein